MPEFRCFTCGGSFEAAVKDMSSPDADDFAALTEAQNEHIASHPDSLKVPMPPVPPKRDWVGDRSHHA